MSQTRSKTRTKPKTDKSNRTGLTARLFDADQPDREVEFDAQTVTSLTDRQLLWIDLQREDLGELPDDFLGSLPFDVDALARQWAAPPGPKLTIHGTYFLARLRDLQPIDGHDTEVVFDLGVGHNVVLTAHEGAIPFLAEINARLNADTSLGEIDALDFAAVVLDGLMTSYLELSDEVLAHVDRLDSEALRSTSRRDLLGDMVALRHRIARIRRALVGHRSVIRAMAGADFGVITRDDSARGFAELTDRYEAAIAAIDAAREALLGTFDIYMSRTGQRTNDIMKALTIVTVLLLPTGAIAGFMGMNEKPPYSVDNPLVFWVVVGLIVVIALISVAVLRARRWL